MALALPLSTGVLWYHSLGNVAIGDGWLCGPDRPLPVSAYDVKGILGANTVGKQSKNG